MEIRDYVFRTQGKDQKDVYTVYEEGKYGLIAIQIPEEQMPESFNETELQAQGGIFITVPQWDEIRANICLDTDSTSPKEMSASHFACDYYVLRDGLWGILDEKGNTIQEPLYNEAILVNNYLRIYNIFPEYLGAPFSRDDTSGCVIVRKDDKWGMLGGQGREILPLIYDSIDIVSYHYARYNAYTVCKDGLYGVTDQTGYFTIPMIYPSLYCDCLDYLRDDTVFRIDGENGIGFVRLGDGKCLVAPEWERVSLNRLCFPSDDEPYGYVYTVWKEGHCGVIFNDRGMIIPPVWDEIIVYRFSFNEPVSYSVRKGERWGCYDADGLLISDAVWDKMGVYYNGMAYVKKDGRWGAIGTDGQLRVSTEWDEIEGFGMERASDTAEKNINTGILQEMYSTTERQLPDCFSWVQRNGLWGLIDKDGSVIAEPVWENHSGATASVSEPERMELRVFVDYTTDMTEADRSFLEWLDQNEEMTLEWMELDDEDISEWLEQQEEDHSEQTESEAEYTICEERLIKNTDGTIYRMQIRKAGKNDPS